MTIQGTVAAIASSRYTPHRSWPRCSPAAAWVPAARMCCKRSGVNAARVSGCCEAARHRGSGCGEPPWNKHSWVLGDLFVSEERGRPVFWARVGSKDSEFAMAIRDWAIESRGNPETRGTPSAQGRSLFGVLLGSH